MHFIYNIGIVLYGFVIKIASFFNPKAKEWVNGRKDYFKNLPEINSDNIYWFHCASLGEFDQALPFINLIKEQDSNVFVLVTFFSPSGFLHYNKRKHKVDFASYLPIDTPKNAKKFVDTFHPKKAFFVKYEFWANYIFELKKQNIELYSISALFRENQHFFKKNAQFFPSILRKFDHFFVQNESSANLLKSININNYTVTGDTRFDRVIENKEQLQPNPVLEHFLNGQKAFIIGSSWPLDEQIIIPLINSDLFKKKIIIAPHSIDENHINQICHELKVPFIRFSDLLNDKPTNKEYSILILDTIGHLASAYHYGEIAYIGGGFSGSLHNILEPAVFGLPVLFGPKFSKYPEATDFIQSKIGYSIDSSERLIENYNNINENLEELKLLCHQFINQNKGASVKIYEHIKSH